MTEISIIMPVYNAERYLEDSVADILQQTYQNFELICVDDGSGDQSLKILKEFASMDSRIVVLKQEKQGAGAARNKGLEYATGKYVLFLDADDRFKPIMLERALAEAQKKELDILLFDAECFDSDTGEKLDSEWIIKRWCIPSKAVFSSNDCEDNIFNLSHNVAWNKLFRMDFIKDNHVKFQNVTYENDTFFVCVALVLANRIAFLDYKLLSYRQNESNSLSSVGVRQKFPLVICDVLITMKKEFIEKGIYSKYKKSFANLAAEKLSWSLSRIINEEHELLFNTVKKEMLTKCDIVSLEKQDYYYESVYDDISAIMNCSTYLEYVFMMLTKVKKDFGELLSYSKRLEKDYYNIKRWKKWNFEMEKIKPDSKIIIYGAGDVGMDYYQQFKSCGKYQIVAWVDKRYKEIEAKDIKIQSPKVIRQYDYDYIIVAVADSNLNREIRSELMNFVDESKLCYNEYL